MAVLLFCLSFLWLAPFLVKIKIHNNNKKGNYH